jgi:hypothetical protein
MQFSEIYWSCGTHATGSNNAPANLSNLIQGFLAKHGIPQVRQAPYSPDMAPCDFWLFPRLKTQLRGSRFIDFSYGDVTKKKYRNAMTYQSNPGICGRH